LPVFFLEFTQTDLREIVPFRDFDRASQILQSAEGHAARGARCWHLITNLAARVIFL
jgi:hypothetical protein